VAPGALTSANRESDDPQNQEDDRSNPQEMDGEPSAKEDEHQQQSEYEQHERRLLFIDFQALGDPREVRG
jgi:hypothetical protein